MTEMRAAEVAAEIINEATRRLRAGEPPEKVRDYLRSAPGARHPLVQKMIGPPSSLAGVVRPSRIAATAQLALALMDAEAAAGRRVSNRAAAARAMQDFTRWSSRTGKSYKASPVEDEREVRRALAGLLRERNAQPRWPLVRELADGTAVYSYGPEGNGE